MSNGNRCELSAASLTELERHHKIAIAVSGGVDSMVLMHAINLWAKSQSKSSRHITVLTVNHALRKEAAAETAFVAKEAKSLELDAVILTWEGEKPTSNIQEAARDARYNLMLSHCTDHGITALLTGHHQNDQAETLLMRLKRGSGIDGLAAIPEVSARNDITILRPLLNTPKKELLAFAKSQELNWIEDPSNKNTDFERVRLRALSQTLEEAGLSSNVLARAAKRAHRARQALDQATNDLLRRSATLNAAGFCNVNLERWGDDTPEELIIRALAKIASAVGASSMPPQLSKMEDLYDVLIAGKASAATLARCHWIKKADSLVVVRELRQEQERSAEENSRSLKPGETRIWDNRFRLALSPEQEMPLEVRFLGRNNVSDHQDRMGARHDIPAEAIPSLVSFWHKDELLFVPHLNFVTDKAEWDSAETAGKVCHVTFLAEATFPSRTIKK